MSELERAEHQDAIELAQRRAVKELSDRLVALGDAHVLALEVGDRAAAEAMHFLTERAPLEIQLSWPLVIAWHRMGKAYEAAEAIGDTAEMRQAAKAQSQILTDRY